MVNMIDLNRLFRSFCELMRLGIMCASDARRKGLIQLNSAITAGTCWFNARNLFIGYEAISSKLTE
jgi:hypothetical protein